MKRNFVLTYIILMATMFFFLEHQKSSTVQNYLQKHTLQYTHLYEMHYEHYQQKSNIIYTLMINNSKVIEIYKKLQNASKEQKDALRDELYALLKNDYESICLEKLRQLHFHLKNNESFLRFHEPSKYGDNLSDVRESIAYVNKYEQPIDGFEEGRVYSGYRFVYPLKDENATHLGSVEISYDMAVFTAEFMSHFNVLSNLHIKKSVVDKKVWKENIQRYNLEGTFAGYYMEKSTLQAILDKTKKQHHELLPNQKSLNNIALKLLDNKADTLYLAESKEVLTIIPLKNSVTGNNVGFLTVRGDGSYISDVMRNFYITLAIGIVFGGIIFVLLYKKIASEKDAKRSLEEQVKYEVEQNRIKDMELLRQNKLSSLGEMMANIAHQWRQPLNAISMSAMSLQVKQELETLKPNDVNESAQSILKSTQYLSEVIEIFRNFVSSNPSVAKVCLQEEIDKAFSIVYVALKDCGIEVHKDVNYDKKIITTMAQGELAQVIINLCNNAKDVILERKIENKWIKITLKEEDELAVLTVEDNGGGINEEIIEKIFEPYFTTKHKSGGTGLGLSMSHKIVVKDFKGKLFVQNTENGAKFFIHIPLV